MGMRNGQVHQHNNISSGQQCCLFQRGDPLPISRLREAHQTETTVQEEVSRVPLYRDLQQRDRLSGAPSRQEKETEHADGVAVVGVDLHCAPSSADGSPELPCGGRPLTLVEALVRECFSAGMRRRDSRPF